jgi:hypothetical protein
MAHEAEQRDFLALPKHVQEEMLRLETCGWVFRRRPDGLWCLATRNYEYRAAMTLWEQVARASRWQAEREELRR